MTSSSHQQGNGQLKSISSNAPCFFKIILQDTIRTGKLGIPRKFVKNHGNDMSSPTLLRVPSGEVWKVELTKCGDKIWLDKGWLKFLNHYSLEFGHLLCFRYDGNSNFHVVIFDRSASEIQYPSAPNIHWRSDEIPVENIDLSEDVDSKQIPRSTSPRRKMRDKLQSACPRPHKMTRSTKSAIKNECNGKSGFQAQNVRHNGYPARKADTRTSHRIIQRLNAQALERASNTFKSEKPCFLVAMQPSYVGLCHPRNCRLSIPCNFVKKHLMKEHCSVILCSSSGKTWIATFRQRQVGEKLNSFLYTGWDTFVQDNNIQVGDVCAFELINSIKISFNVVIYKGQLANCHQSSANSSWELMEALTTVEKANAFQIASAFKSENPFFVVELQPSYVHRPKLYVPVNFARQYLSKMRKEVIALLLNGKSWPVMYDEKQRIKRLDVFFCKGWHKFVMDNSLEVGDACVFELLKDPKTSMNVTIYKKQLIEDANMVSSFGDKSIGKQAEVPESLVIKTETAWMKEKGDMCNLHNQHPRTSDLNMMENNDEPTREVLDNILM